MYERFARAASAYPSQAAAQSAGFEPDAAIEAAFVPVDAPAATDENANDPETHADAAGAGLAALTELFKGLTSRLHLQDLSMDDLLVLGIVFLILRKNAEWDVALIMGVLFFLGLFDDAKT